MIDVGLRRSCFLSSSGWVAKNGQWSVAKKRGWEEVLLMEEKRRSERPADRMKRAYVRESCAGEGVVAMEAK